MKTISSMVLPVYDRKAKQNYERIKYANLDMLRPIKTPQWRLPSMLWNVEADDPGEIVHVGLYDEDNTATTININGSWVNGAANPFDTFTIAGLNITSAIKLAAAAADGTLQDRTAGTSYGIMSVEAGDTITVTGTFLRNSGAVNPYIRFYICDTGGWGADGADITLTTGEINASHTFAAGGFVEIVVGTTGAVNFSFTDVEIKIDNIISVFDTTDTYANLWANGSYDTFTLADAYCLSQVQKAAGAGEQYFNNSVAVGTVPATITIGESIRIKTILTFIGGATTAPKMELRNTGTGAVISNTVTITEGTNYFVLTATATLASGWAIYVYNEDGETTNYSIEFAYVEKSVIPKLYTELTDEYFQYKGETLGHLLPEGIYYLKFTTADGHVYYSEYFEVDCIYKNLITGLTNFDYETFSRDGTEILSAINTAGNADAISDAFSIVRGESLKVIFFLTLNSGDAPRINIISGGVGIAVATVPTVLGLNELTITSEETSDVAYFDIYNTTNTNYSTSEILVIREYSDKYVTVNFSNTCDLGDIVYSDGMIQTMWLESEPLEYTFPIEEEGAKDGLAKFHRSFARQDKKYLLRTLELPDYMAEVVYRIMLHDTVELVDRVGDTHDVYNWEPEAEYLWDDKYYVRFDITFDYDEAFVIGGCCNNLT